MNQTLSQTGLIARHTLVFVQVVGVAYPSYAASDVARRSAVGLAYFQRTSGIGAMGTRSDRASKSVILYHLPTEN
jgi:hypothetical protein